MSEGNDHLADAAGSAIRRHRPTLPTIRPRHRRPVRTRLRPGDARYLQRILDFRQLLNGEWYWDIFVALHKGPLRYGDLLNAVRARTPANNWPGKSHRYLQDGTLSRTLGRLMEAELVERDDPDKHFPFRTTYRLTPHARQLLAVMAPAAEWADSHTDLLVRVQERRCK
ncbi:helix-turn-helix domain-containing protein [Streptomyces sp. NPDC020719]|uniref:winged helix-turn-helix transcriptional regulator n=1 Tax=Streptomyces sp. NPDC020719 TaxID=3154896 RepID=UPI0034107327